ncbi:RHS repeat-associated core domain-containing protein [Pseudomonas sp. MYb118]|uniref:RHS repeat-associated core domain-containing protein n=1 Tax=Pseudomonas sp. MYb118 TaxID=1848720 RepID=UPI0034CDEC7A
MSDARGLSVRAVGYHRREANDPIDTRITQQRYDAVGRLIASRDPYLFDLAQTDEGAPFNLNQVLSLSATALLTESVDAGWRASLLGDSDQYLQSWDGRGSSKRAEYDELMRPVALCEAGIGIAEHVIERFTYGDARPEAAAHNLCGQLVRHDDPAGAVLVQEAGLSGLLLKHTRRFLTGTEAPDWPLTIADRDALLESGAGLTTFNAYAASGEALSQTDAMGNTQSSGYTRAGQLKDARLTLAGAGQSEKLLVSNLHYNAMGQIEAETAGNGVVTRHRYDEANGRLIELSAHKSDGTPLQQLQYQYDAVGNVLSIEDAAQPIRYFNNQRIEPIKSYRYDTLDQLIEATGSEAVSGIGGPALPDWQPLPVDPSQIANYTQTFHYDSGGNLLSLVHVGAQAQGRTLTRAKYSNRCLPERDGRPPTEAELAAGFDANGNLQELQPGQRLLWDLRNQLREVKPVVREDADDDRECYVYDGGGQRVRKVRSSVTVTRTMLSEVRYLPGLEIRNHGGTGETLHVINISAGSNNVQILHWAHGLLGEALQNQMRYGCADHLKSNTLELDQHADLICQEAFYPYGGTAFQAGRNMIEAKYKLRRYCAKERDFTGLLYYGFRYYAPWLQRWINPDPAEDADGLNRFRMVGNSAIMLVDANGLCGNSGIDTKNAEGKLDSSAYHISYIDINLEKKLTSDTGKSKRIEFVRTNLTHTRKRNQVDSRFKTDTFINYFRPNIWIFTENFKYQPDYFASDVAEHQYTLQAKAKGFYGELPSRIARTKMRNQSTLDKTKDLPSGSDALLAVFMKETSNGKSTQQILNVFGLRAISVKKAIKGTDVDFIITVEPAPNEEMTTKLTPMKPRKKQARVTTSATAPIHPKNHLPHLPVSSIKVSQPKRVQTSTRQHN